MTRFGSLAYYAPRAAVAVVALGLIGVVGSALTRYLNAYVIQVLFFVGCNVILAVSLNLVNGHAGQFSIGHAGFMAIGAYLTAWISVTYGKQWLAPFEDHPAAWVIGCAYLVALMLVGGLGAALGGLVIGLPSLRLRGDYLAIATLGFGEIIKVLLLNIDAVGGARGLTGIPRYSTLGLCLAAAVVTVVLLRNLMGSTHGRALLALREDETAAEAVGIDVASYKTSAFVIGAFFAGVAGCLYAHYLQYINPRGFDFMKSIELVLIVVLGGGNIWGVIVAAVAVTLLPEALRNTDELLAFLPAKWVSWVPDDPRMVIYSALLIGVMLLKARKGRQRDGPPAKGGG